MSCEYLVYCHFIQWLSGVLVIDGILSLQMLEMYVIFFCFISKKEMKHFITAESAVLIKVARVLKSIFLLKTGMFFSWRPIKKDSVTPYVLFDEYRQFYPLCFYPWRPIKKQQRYPLCFFSWRPIKNDSYPSCFIWEKRQSLCFFSWRPIKNNSVTPYGFFHDDQRKTTVSPLMFHFIKTTYLLIDKYRQCYPLCFFSWRPIKNNSVAPYVFFHDNQ